MPPRCQDHQHNASASPQLACRALPLRSLFAAAAALSRSQASAHPTEAAAPEPGPWGHGHWAWLMAAAVRELPECLKSKLSAKSWQLQVMMWVVWDADQTPGLWEWLSDLESGM